MQSGFLKLSAADLGKGLVVAIIGVVLAALQQAFTAHGLDFGTYDWGMIVNVAITAGIGYLAKNLLSNSDGKFLGRVG